MAIDIEAPGANEADLEAALFALAPFRGARVKRTSDQTAVNATAAVDVTWQATVADTDSFWSAGSPTRLTIPATYNGKYANAQAHVRIDSTTSDTFKNLFVRHYNSSGTLQYISGVTIDPTLSGGVFASVSLLCVPVATGDYFVATVQEQSDTSVTLVAGSSGLALQIIG